MNKFFSALIMLSIFVLSGCAIGNSHNYKNVVANIMASGTSAVGVATLDHRQEILNGETIENVSGWMRGGFGNPFKVTTASSLPLAEEMNMAVASSLSQKGYKTTEVRTIPMDSIDDVVFKLRKTDTNKSVLLLVNEWFSDTFSGTDIEYDMELMVFDNHGKKIASNKIKDRANIGGGFNAVAAAEKAVPVGFKQKLEELFNTTEIIRVLSD